MNLPQLNEFASSQDVSDVFAGYNHNLIIGNGEFYDMKNMTSDYYPILSPREKRGTYAEPSNLQGIISKEKLCYVDGSDFYVGTSVVHLGLSTDSADCPKTLVSMGAYVIVFPDKKYVNTADLTDYGSMEAETTTESPIRFDLCRVNGEVFTITYRQATEPTSPTNAQYWIDTSVTPNVLKQYSTTSGMWVQIATTYIRIESSGIGASFAQYDGVNITGLKGQTYVDHDSQQTFTDTDLDAIDGSFVIWERGTDYIVVIGMLSQSRYIDNHINVSRKLPKMDFVTESQNRLWGCRYGESNDGKIVNEIYASKQGDFKNWSCFMGLSTDSYVASCGTDGRWTGAVTYLGYPIFFKENVLHKVYGNYPANYQIQDTACNGVQWGSGRSLAIVGGVLYYKSKLGVCAYDGSLPVEVSKALGELRYSDAVACAFGNKYYISMQDASNNYSLFVYDAEKGMWFKEDSTKAIDFANWNSELYYCSDDGKIKSISGAGTVDAEPVEWMVESGVIGTYITPKKYISKLNVRMSLAIGSIVRFYIQYDSVGDWELISTMQGTSLRSFTVPIRPKRCDHFRLKVVGTGEAKIYSIIKNIEQGSDI